MAFRRIVYSRDSYNWNKSSGMHIFTLIISCYNLLQNVTSTSQIPPLRSVVSHFNSISHRALIGNNKVQAVTSNDFTHRKFLDALQEGGSEAICAASFIDYFK